MQMLKGILFVVASQLALWWSPLQASAPAAVPSAQLLHAPLRFEPNRGQSDPQVRFLARGLGYGMFVADDEVQMRFDAAKVASPPVVLRLRLEDAEAVRPRARLRQRGRSNYLSLDGSRTPIVDLPHYSELVQRGRYPGIDVVWYGADGDRLEYDFVLAPGADPGRIALRFEGGDSLRVSADGELELGFGGRTLVQRAPVAFQYAAAEVSAESDPTRWRHSVAQREPVASSYVLDADGSVRFELGDYDRSRPLVIDPVFAYGSYIGGSLDDGVHDIAVNAAGEVYATGYTASSNFPLANALDGSHGGGLDAFLLKLDAAGGALLYSTFLGNTGDQIGRAVVLDSAGRPYVAGYNAVSDADGDAFVLRLNAAGNLLEYSRTFGGSLADSALGLAVDGAGQAIVTGYTDSTDFPTVNPIHAHLGARECFFARLNAGDGLLNYSTFLGGTGDQTCAAVGYHAASGFAYVGGTNTRFDAAGDPVVLKLNFDSTFGNGDWSRTIQTGGADAGNGLAVDAVGSVWLVGNTEANDFPQQNTLQGRGGGPDAFVLRMDASGNQTLASYLGGFGSEYATDAALDASGRLHIAGSHASFEYSALLWRLAPNGSGIDWQGDFGSGAQATAVATDGVASYLGGHTSGSSATTVGAFATSPRGGGDGWLAKVVAGTPSVRVGDRSYVESTVNLGVTISVEPPSLVDIPLHIHTADGSAQYTVDYTFTSSGTDCHSTGTWIPAGSPSYTCVTRLLHDTLDEDDEDFFVRIEDVVNANVADAEGRIVITDDDPRPSLSISDASAPEGDPCAPSELVFTVTLSRASGRVVEVPWATANGSALAGSDYVASSGSLRFEPGETSKTLSIPVLSDSLVEGNETLVVNLTEPPTAVLLDGQGVATISNSPFPTLAIANASAGEGTGQGGVLNFALTSSPALACAFDISWSTADGTAGSADYTAATGAAHFAAQQTSATVAVNLVGDSLDEPDETLQVNLGALAWGALGDGSATGTILDDDAAPALAVDNGGCSVTEGHSGSVSCNFVARLSAVSGRTVTFSSATANGSATAGADYTGHASTARSIPAGQTTLTIAVPVLGDTLDEPNESFALNLSGIANATPGTLSATGTINDDDAAPTLSIDNGGCTVTEGHSGSVNCNFVARLSAASSVAVTFNSATANGSASAGADYTGHASTARSIPAGQTTLTIAVPVQGDTLDEDNETFALNLNGIANATPGSLSATGTISDDDATPTLSIDNGGCSVTEGNSGSVNCSFVARLSAVSGRAVSFTTGTANGTATAGSDYTGHSAITRTLAAGNQTLTVLVPVLGDTADEPNETFTLNLTAVSNATPGTLSGTGTIIDDDEPVTPGTLRLRDATLLVGENSGSVQIVVERVGGSSGAASVQYATANGSAIAGLDYGAASGTLNWAAGDAGAKTITLSILFDPAVEPQESFTLNLSQASGASLGSPATTTVTIVDGAQMLHANGFE